MTRDRAKELLPIIQAFAEGKAIQARAGGSRGTWEDLADPYWHNEHEYRIKPEPLEFWAVIQGGHVVSVRDSEDEALRTIKYYSGSHIAKFKEVL